MSPPSDDLERAANDFEWPPSADELSVHDLRAEPGNRLQDVSTQVFAARHGETPVLRPGREGWRTTELTGTLIVTAIMVAAAAVTLDRLSTPPVPVDASHLPSPGATTTEPTAPAAAAGHRRPPDITIVATYPVDRGGVSPPAAEAVAPDVAADTPLLADAADLSLFATAPPSLPVDATLPAAPAPPPRSAEVEGVGPVPASPEPTPEAAHAIADADIRQLLRRYEAAYDDRSVQATAAVWPTVDRRALTRAFATLDRQDVSFDQCDVDVSGERGSAVCVGTVRYVPSIGRGVEKAGRITWTFDLARAGEDWRITRLSAR